MTDNEHPLKPDVVLDLRCGLRQFVTLLLKLKGKHDFENKAFSGLTWSAETKAARTNMMLK